MPERRQIAVAHRNLKRRHVLKACCGLALCAPVVAKEAKAQRKDLIAHYAHLTVHGILHLQGYEHEDTRAAQAMEALEKRILKRLGFPDPYSPPPDHGPTQ